MPPLPWVNVKSPSAAIVQKQYVDTRLKELEAAGAHATAAALFVIEQYLLGKMPANRRPRTIPVPELQRVFRAIQANLQSAELTINFGANTWFTNPNPYDTYTQMYQRAVKGGVMTLMNTKTNQADIRAGVDDIVSFPKSWQAAAPATPRRGLRPGVQDPSRMQTQMATGPMTNVANPGELAAWLSGNKHFNPDTKQIFLGVNYGRRAHGSATGYGWSYFVAKSDLKPRCLYYARDTFSVTAIPDTKTPNKYSLDTSVDAQHIQISFNNLAGVLGLPGEGLRRDIFESCYEGKVLQDIGPASGSADRLLEAHHFGEMTFREHVDHMVISPVLEQVKNAHGMVSVQKTIDAALWARVVANAKEFTTRNGIRLYQTA